MNIDNNIDGERNDFQTFNLIDELSDVRTNETLIDNNIIDGINDNISKDNLKSNIVEELAGTDIFTDAILFDNNSDVFDNDIPNVNLKSINVGELNDYQTFNRFGQLSLIWTNANLSIDTKQRKLIITTSTTKSNSKYTSYIIVYSFTSFVDFSSISIDREQCHLIFSSIHSPRLYKKIIKDNIEDIFYGNATFKRILLDGTDDQSDVTNDLHSLASFRSVDLTFEISKWHILHDLMSLLPVPAFAGRVTFISSDTMKLPDISKVRDKSILNCMWYLKTIVDNRNIPSYGNFKNILIDKVTYNMKHNKCINEMIVVLQELPLLLRQLSLSSKRNGIIIFQDSLSLLHNIKAKSLKLLLQPIDIDNWYYIKRIMVTPSRIICLPDGFMKGSRMLRQFMTKDNRRHIISVQFVDEEFQKIKIKSLLSYILDNGLEIYGIQYRCLCGSNSKIRESSYYFINGDATTINQYRDQIIYGSLSRIPKIAKQVNNLALYCTCDTFILDIPQSRWYEIEDSYSIDGHLNTDGSGFISRKIADIIISKLDPDMNGKTAAFQIRLGGLKGVLVIDNTGILPINKDIGFRKSMKKFESNNFSLCVVKVCKYVDLYLAHESINLISSFAIEAAIQGVSYFPGPIILGMHEVELDKIAEIFLDKTYALRVLSEYLDIDIIKSISTSNIDILTEPMWVSLLHKIYQIKIKSLRTKSRIFVQDGCVLTGIPDRSGSLKSNEVFLQIQKSTDSEPRVITGPVLLYRHPCLHPGDMQICIAIDQPSLRDLVNVIVLPVDPTGPSLSSNCSGGDLDGDQFAIIFDKDLVPPACLQQKSLNYEELADQASSNKSLETVCETIEEFYAKIGCNEYLGRIANMHLAFSDYSDLGAHHPIAKKLSSQQSIAVDMPKTGIEIIL